MYQNADKVTQVQNYVKTQYYSSESPIHNLYLTCFNAVDLGDRYYAKVDDGHTKLDWHQKMIYALLKLGIVNSYIFFIHKEWCDWIDFRRKLGKKLINPQFK